MINRVSRAWVESIIAVVVTCGCSSLTGRPLEDPPRACTTRFFFWTSCEEASGVPYALSRPSFSIQQKTLAGGKRARSVNEIVVSYEADESRRFEVGMTRGFLTNDTFELSLDPTGRAVAMNSARADQTGKTIAALATAAAAAAGVAARAGLLSETKGLVLAPMLCKWMDQQPMAEGLGQALADHDKERGKLEEDKKAGGDKRETDQRTLELQAREEQLKRLVERTRCSDIEKKVGVAGSAVCNSIDDTCRELIKGITDKASRVLAGLVCSAARYSELLDPPKEDEPSLTKWAQIAELKRVTEGTEPADKLMEQFKKLRRNVDVALSEAVVAGLADRPGKVVALNEAIDAYKDTLLIVLNADDHLSNRVLRARRQLLLGFVSRNAPTGRGEGDTYAKYRSELDAVDLALQEVLPKAKAAEEAAPVDATDLTRTIDTGVLTERYSKRLTDEQLQNRIALANVQVGVGCATAVVIADPEMSSTGGSN